MSETDKLWSALTANAVACSCEDAVCIPVGIDGTNSRNYICRLWEGVYLWGNEIYEHFIPEELCSMWELNIAAVNLCMKGRCETALENDTFVYMSPGLLNINTNAPKDGYYYPGDMYEGLEIAFDLDVLSSGAPRCLKELGFDTGLLYGLIKGGSGSCMAEVGEAAMKQAERLYSALKASDLTLEEYRFLTVQLMHTLVHGGAQNNRRPLEEVHRGGACGRLRHKPLGAEKVLRDDIRRPDIPLPQSQAHGQGKAAAERNEADGKRDSRRVRL